MAKTIKEAAITTASAREKLGPGVYWRVLDSEAQLGYRKGKRAGVWFARWRNHYHGANYKQAPVGPANDTNDKRVPGLLTFLEAEKEARVIVAKKRAEAEAAASGPVLTVGMAVDAYVQKRNERESRRAGRPINSDAWQRLTLYVTGREGPRAVDPAPIAGVRLHELKKDDLTAWRANLPAVSDTTAQRLTNDFKAALNAAWSAHSGNLAGLCPNLPNIIKDGLKPVEVADDELPTINENQILADGEVVQLLRAAREIDAEQNWDGDLYRIVLVLTATGARFSQVARLRVVDFQVAKRRLMVPQSRKGKKKQLDLIPVPIGDDVMEALVPCTGKRRPDEPLLERWRHVQVKGSTQWTRVSRGGWQSSAELKRPWQAIRERAGLPHVIAYALRHTSIVNKIRDNLPLRIVAALHDTSTAIIERHYARWITSGLEDMVRSTVKPLVPDDDRKVVRLQQKCV